jgi:(1->4)-alpha-D-glucan 1-alpha-D-glucosylmutase
MTLAAEVIEKACIRITADQRLPESTYRVQFHKGFTFRDAAGIVPYLAELGVTHLYASPFLKARPGSTHGYDIIDHCRLNPELGTEADFEALVEALHAHGMSQILDMVPNHVGVGTNDNAWWNDVLEKGTASRYAEYFDISWRGSPRPELKDKVLLPVLGDTFGAVLEKGQLRLAFENGAFAVHYYDRRFPISPQTYGLIVEDQALVPQGSNHLQARQKIEQAVTRLNGHAGDARSFDALDRLLSAQHYRLCHWRVAADEINYRRFFDINDLAALRMERREVFDATHGFVIKLLCGGKISGLRIDHPDGLYDPRQYFQRLQQAFVLAEAKRIAETDRRGSRIESDELERAIDEKLANKPSLPLYVVAEKILATDEPMPADWAVHGTSGYDFLNMVNGLFIDPAAAGAMTETYHAVAGNRPPIDELIYQKKRLILSTSLSSELHMLAHQLDRIAQSNRHSRDFTLNGLRHALREVIACFPVYRSYITDEGFTGRDVEMVDAAVEAAIEHAPHIARSIFHFIRHTLLHSADGASPEILAQCRHFAGKFQQLTAPVTAKGIEDTVFYIDNRFISLNEVGGDPGRFGVSPESLHLYLIDRQQHWPFAMSCLSTHDTKRSEDVRARLNVLSEIPEQWCTAVKEWWQLNAPLRIEDGGKLIPDPNDEYLLYQTLIGAWPVQSTSEQPNEAFVKRIQAYMQKAAREAKVHTSWTDPNETYESGIRRFVAAVLQHRPFLNRFIPFQFLVTRHGLLYSLSQTLLRIAAPGVPDTYQGTDCLDFSLVDPDNRRPVDYGRRRQMLAEIRDWIGAAGNDRTMLMQQLLAKSDQGYAKLFLVERALNCRKHHPGLFSAGEYLPAQVTGLRSDCLFAFARRQAGRWALAAAPRFTSRLGGADTYAFGPGAWSETLIHLPGLPENASLFNVLTGQRFKPQLREQEAFLAAEDLFGQFPVALMLAE